MFDFAWSEIALVGVVALVLIGPKDMPIALKYVSGAVKKAKRMAAEFQGHVDEMVRDADLHEVRDHIRDIRSLDIRGTVTRALDSDGSIRRAFTEDPIRTPPPVVTTPVEAMPEHSIATPEHSIATPEHSIATSEHSIAIPADNAPPAHLAFGEPGAADLAPAAPAFIPPHATAPASPPPAFIPPSAAH